MDNTISAGSAFWLEVFSAAVLGSVLIVGLAAAGQRLLRAAVWQRTLWQTAMAALLVFAVAQWLGLSAVAARLVELALVPAGDASPSSTPASENVVEVGQPEATDARPYHGEVEPWVAGLVGLPPGHGLAALESLAAMSQPESHQPATSGPMPWRHSRAMKPVVRDLVPGPGDVWWPPALWLLGSVVVALRIAWSRWTLARFRQQHAAMGSEVWGKCVRSLAARLGIRRPVTLLQVPGLDAPVAFGLFRRTVAVPAEFARGPLGKERESVLAHELAHLASGDPFWQLLTEVACAAWWWQPWVWWARRRLRDSSEAAADEASVLVPGGPDALASCLVALGRQRIERRWGWLSFHGTRFRSALGRRVERLLSLAARPHGQPAPCRLAIVKVALCGTLAAGSMLLTGWATPPVARQTGDSTTSVLRSAWRGSLAAVALTAWLGPDPARAAAAERPEPEAKTPPDHGPPPRHELEPRPQRPPGPHPGSGGPGKAPPPKPPRLTPEEGKEFAQRYLQELEVKFRELSEAGKHEEATRVEQEMAQIRTRIEGRPAPPPEPREPLSPEQRERRVRHLRAAAENLRAAAMEREAQSFTRLADRLEEGGEMPPTRWPRLERELMAGQGAGIPEPRVPGPPGGPRPESLEPVLRELREQILDLRRQLEELREQVQKDGKRPSPPEK